MRFLVDAQLPKSLSEFLKWKGFDSLHTLELPQKNKTSDALIIQIAESEKRVVISKDDDFLDSHLIHSIPTKLILVKTGNIHNNQLLELFNRNLGLIIELITQSNLVEINRHMIAEHKK